MGASRHCRGAICLLAALMVLLQALVIGWLTTRHAGWPLVFRR